MMSKHASKPYNPGIANVFYLAGYIESWGRGIEKICNACQEDGSPQPEFSINPEDIMIKFTAAENRIIRSVTPNVTEKVTERVTEKVTEKEQQVLNLIIEDPGYTSKMMADKLTLSRKTITDRLRSLKDKGIIQRIGSDTKGYWKINE